MCLCGFLCSSEWLWPQPVTWTSVAFPWTRRRVHWSWRAVGFFPGLKESIRAVPMYVCVCVLVDPGKKLSRRVEILKSRASALTFWSLNPNDVKIYSLNGKCLAMEREGGGLRRPCNILSGDTWTIVVFSSCCKWAFRHERFRPRAFDIEDTSFFKNPGFFEDDLRWAVGCRSDSSPQWLWHETFDLQLTLSPASSTENGTSNCENNIQSNCKHLKRVKLQTSFALQIPSGRPIQVETCV